MWCDKVNIGVRYNLYNSSLASHNKKITYFPIRLIDVLFHATVVLSCL